MPAMGTQTSIPEIIVESIKQRSPPKAKSRSKNDKFTVYSRRKLSKELITKTTLFQRKSVAATPNADLYSVKLSRSPYLRSVS